jgi:hypothetical protein
MTLHMPIDGAIVILKAIAEYMVENSQKEE